MAVLDVGSGTGFPALELAERLGRAGRVIGVDPSAPGTRRSRDKARAYEAPNVVFVRSVAERLPVRTAMRGPRRLQQRLQQRRRPGT